MKRLKPSVDELYDELTSPPTAGDYLRNLAERLMHVPVMYGTDQSDTDQLLQLASKVLPFDAFESHPCITLNDKGERDKNGKNVEQVSGNEGDGYDFISVYGHQPGGGLDCIADFDSPQEAAAALTALNALAELMKRGKV